MSYDATDWAMEQKLLGLQKIVLLAIAWRAKKTNSACFPSIKTLADDCGISKRSVTTQILFLKKSGLIKVINRSKDGAKTSNEYVVLMTAPSAHPAIPYAPPAIPLAHHVRINKEGINKEKRERLSFDKPQKSEQPLSRKDIQQGVERLMAEYPVKTPASKFHFICDAYVDMSVTGHVDLILSNAMKLQAEGKKLPTLESFLRNKEKYWSTQVFNPFAGAK